MSSARVPAVAALLLSVLAYLGLPLSSEDPLRGTLVILPLVIAALVIMGRWARDRGGRPTPTPVATAEAIALAVGVLLALARSHLGLRPGTTLDAVIAAGFALLLTHRLGWLVLALRPALGQRLPTRPPWPFFVLPLTIYLAILPWSSAQHPPDGDEPHYLLLTHSLAYDLDTDLTNNYEAGHSLSFMDRELGPQQGDPVGQQGELYSRHNMLLPLLLAPFYRLGGVMGALAVMAALTAATCWSTLALASGYVPEHPGETLVVWSILAFTSPLLLFSFQVWVEIPAALLTLLVLTQIQRLGSGAPYGWRGWLGFALPLVLLPMLKIRFVLVAVPLAVLALWRAGKEARRGIVVITLGLGLLTGAILIFNQLVFRNPLKFHDIDGLRRLAYPPSQYLQGFTGLFFDCAFGLFAYAPIWMLLLPAAVMALYRRSRLLSDYCVVFAPYLLLLFPRGEWFGGWSPPFRYGIVTLPLLALWLVPLWVGRRRTGARFLIALLATLTLTLTVLWLVEPGWTYNLAHGRTHLLDQLSTRLSADVARLFPSSTRIRLASVVWPPTALVVVAALWIVGKRRGLRATSLWGTVMALLLPALVIWTAQNRATRVVEFEDPWIHGSTGQVHPGLWVIYRPQYRGGWTLPPGASVEVPVVAGGTRLDLKLDLRALPKNASRATLEFSDGHGGILDQVEIAPLGPWTSVELEDLAWESDSSLRISLADDKTKPRPRVILDRAFLRWR